MKNNRLLSQLPLIGKISSFCADFLIHFESIYVYIVEKLSKKDGKKSHFNDQMEVLKKSNKQYTDLLSRLFHTAKQRGVKLALEQVKALDDVLGSPSKAFQSVHVGGTNGKGSVTLKISKGLEQAGYRVGLYTSPHISSFRERIRINGDPISEEAIVY